MSGPTVLLDPTAELAPFSAGALHARAATLDGLCVGILDISKARGNVFLDRVDELLTGRGIAVKRYRKSTFTHRHPTC